MSGLDKAVMEFALSFPVDVRSVSHKGFYVTIKTDEKERCKLAENHGLVAVDTFVAEFHIRLWKRQGIGIRGWVNASVIQTCVITAEYIENVIDQAVDVVYVPHDSRLVNFPEFQGVQEIFLDAEGPDAPETFHGNEIDIGAVAEEFFELAIDPYPRKTGTSFKTVFAHLEDIGRDEKGDSPFAILKRLRRL